MTPTKQQVIDVLKREYKKSLYPHEYNPYDPDFEAMADAVMELYK